MNDFMKTAAVFGLVLLVVAEPSFASDTASGMPWESPLEKIVSALTGPTALAIAMLGVFVTGASLIFGGELNEWTRRLVMLVLVVSLLTVSGQFLTGLFNITGAVIL